MNSAILFLTCSKSQETLARFRSIRSKSDKLMIAESRFGLGSDNEIPIWEFQIESLPYKCISDKAVPGSTVLAVVNFLVNHEFDYAWLIEDDVVFTGDWSCIDAMNELDFDFIGANTHPAREDCSWRSTFCPSSSLADNPFCLLKSLCCVCRLSRVAALKIHELLIAGFRGHHEILVPTLIDYLDLPQTDLITLGQIDPSLFRWRPCLTTEEIDSAKHGLFLHPCKISD